MGPEASSLLGAALPRRIRWAPKRFPRGLGFPPPSLLARLGPSTPHGASSQGRCGRMGRPSQPDRPLAAGAKRSPAGHAALLKDAPRPAEPGNGGLSARADPGSDRVPEPVRGLEDARAGLYPPTPARHGLPRLRNRLDLR